jgi:hypothetical protein
LINNIIDKPQDVLKALVLLKEVISVWQFDKTVFSDEFLNQLDIVLGIARDEKYEKSLKGIRTKLASKNVQDPPVFSQPAPKQVLPKTIKQMEGKPFKIVDWDPLEIARQLTLVDYKHLKNISHNHFYQTVWTDDWDMKKYFSLRHDSVVNWVVGTVLTELDLAIRSKIISKFVEVVRKLEELQNLDSMHAIVTALGKPSIQRLKGTWKKIQVKFTEFCKLLNVIHPKELEKIILNPPCIPYLGITLYKLEEVAKIDSTKDKLINFTKRVEYYQIYNQFMTSTEAPYNLTGIDWVTTALNFEKMPILGFEDELRLSKYCEN